MQTKLTLSVDQEVIDRAKEYARQQGISLSKLVQQLLSKEAKPKKTEVEVPEALKGVYGAFELPEDFDYKKEKAKYLWEKYNSLE